MHNIYLGLENKNDTKIVFLDFSKAFDRVWHKGLLYKLISLGVSGNLLQLLTDYLSNRRQQVLINGEISNITFLTTGSPIVPFLYK